MELAPSRSKQVDDVEKPGNPVIADREPARVAAVQAMSEGGDEPLQQPPMPADATLHRIGDDTRERRQDAEREGKTGHGPDDREQTRRGRKHPVPETAEPGPQGKALDGVALGRFPGERRTQAHHPERQLPEHRGADRHADDRRAQLRHRGPAQPVCGELVLKVATERRIARSPGEFLQDAAVRGLGSRVAEHLLGEGIAGRFAPALSIWQPQQLGVNEPRDLAGDVGLAQELPATQPLGGPAPTRPPRQRGAGRQQHHLRQYQHHVDRSAQEVPAEGPPMQRPDAGKREVVVDERDDARPRRLEVAIDRVRDDCAGERTLGGLRGLEPAGGIRCGDLVHAVMFRCAREGYRDDNPAGDAISAALPKAAVRKQHMRALPHAEVRAALQRVKGSGAYLGTMLAFEFLVLTAARSGEVRNARWEQIDRDGAVWTIPAERMKAGREHRVPLSPRALEVLDSAAELFDGQGLVFPSPTGRVLNHATLTDLLHGLGIDAVAHGFRSSFRDWAAECTDAPREVCELALAHVNSDWVEAAYRRSDLFDRRRVLMNDWAAYIA